MRRALRTAIARLAPAVALCWPGLASACAVCFTGRTEETRVAFGVSTAFMTVLPLLLVGSTVWWLRRRARALSAGAVRKVPVSTQSAG